MNSFYVESILAGEASTMAPELLAMQGVNYELMPIVKMTAPKDWHEEPICEWPAKDYLFTSVILLFGVIPIDLHRFGLLNTRPNGFRESSTSLLMATWRHEREIEDLETGVRVKDSVEFQPTLKFLSTILAPIYLHIFKHRHKRLQKKYGLKIS